MKRRAFIAGLGAAALPVAARAQQAGKVWRVGMLDTTPATINGKNIDAFRAGMRTLGDVEGQNLRIDYRSFDGHIEPLPQQAAELVGLRARHHRTRATAGARRQEGGRRDSDRDGGDRPAGRIRHGGEPGAAGRQRHRTFRVRHPAHPEAYRAVERAGAGHSPIGALDNTNLSVPAQWDETKAAAQALGIEAVLFDVRKPEDIAPSFDAAIAKGVDAFAVGNDLVVIAIRVQITELAAKHRLPAIYASREYIDAGGLIAYAAHYPDLYRRAATYVDKTFKAPAGRPAGRAADQAGNCGQSQSGEGAWPDGAANVARPRRRGDRMRRRASRYPARERGEVEPSPRLRATSTRYGSGCGRTLVGAAVPSFSALCPQAGRQGLAGRHARHHLGGAQCQEHRRLQGRHEGARLRRGKNLVIDYRSLDGRSERLPELVAELLRLKCDVLVTRGTPATLAAKKATSAMPIVMAAVGEPVETGLAQSLARPGGNVTGPPPSSPSSRRSASSC